MTPSQEVKELFDPNNSRTSLTINGKAFQQLPNNKNMIRLFSGATEKEIKDFFTQLGGKTLPSPRTITNKDGSTKGVIYVIEISKGKNLTLRNFSTSDDRTGAKWTIDVPAGMGHSTNQTEIKFK